MPPPVIAGRADRDVPGLVVRDQDHSFDLDVLVPDTGEERLETLARGVLSWYPATSTSVGVSAIRVSFQRGRTYRSRG